MSTLNIDLHQNNWVHDLKERYSPEEFSKNLNNFLHLGYLISKTTKISLNEDHILEPINNKFSKIDENCVSNLEKIKDLEYSLKYELNDFKNNISNTLQGESLETRNQCENLTNVILKLTGNIATSSLKGKIGEEFISSLLKNNFPDDTINETNKNSHESDIHLISQTTPTILIESKIYTSCVNTKEIDKFISDMDNTCINYGLFVSLTSPIIKHRRLEYNYINGKHIIFLPDAGFDGNNIIYGILFLKEISKLSNENIINKSLFEEKSFEIKNILSNFEQSYSHLTKLKNKTMDTKISIDKLLSELTIEICESELIIKNIVESTKRDINTVLQLDNYIHYTNDLFDELILDLTESNKIKNVSVYLQLIRDNKYTVFKSESDSNIFKFVKNKSDIHLKIFKTKCIFNFNNGIIFEIKDNNNVEKFKEILNLI